MRFLLRPSVEIPRVEIPRVNLRSSDLWKTVNAVARLSRWTHPAMVFARDGDCAGRGLAEDVKRRIGHHNHCDTAGGSKTKELAARSLWPGRHLGGYSTLRHRNLVNRTYRDQIRIRAGG
jgi:hypothetical protein